MNATRFTIILAATIGWSVSLAGASVQPIGEFSGQFAEGFESIMPPGGSPMPLSIFGGAATMDDTLAHYNVIAYSWQNGDASIFVYPYDGNLFAGSVAGSTLFQFPTPITDFGGYLNTVAPLPNGTVNFRNSVGGLIASLPVTITPGEWAWQGWHSDTPVSSIEVVGAGVPGFGTLYDDMQMTLAPEPAALALLVLGGLLARRR